MDMLLQVSAGASDYSELARKITNLTDAVSALNAVAEQGGGTPGGSDMLNVSAGPLGGPDGLAHFARFKEIAIGREYGPGDSIVSGPTGPERPVDWHDVFKFDANPALADFAPGTTARARSLAFASNYTSLLVRLHNVFNGQPATLMSTLGAMYALRGMARTLMQTDDPRHPGSWGVGPSWEYVPSASHYESRGRHPRPAHTATD